MVRCGMGNSKINGLVDGKGVEMWSSAFVYQDINDGDNVVARCRVVRTMYDTAGGTSCLGYYQAFKTGDGRILRLSYGRLLPVRYRIALSTIIISQVTVQNFQPRSLVPYRSRYRTRSPILKLQYTNAALTRTSASTSFRGRRDETGITILHWKQYDRTTKKLARYFDTVLEMTYVTLR